MADNKETLAQAMFGKSADDLEREEQVELKKLAGRGHQGTAEAGEEEFVDAATASNVNEPGAAPARGLGGVHVGMERDESGPRRGSENPGTPSPGDVRKGYDQERPHETRRGDAPPA